MSPCINTAMQYSMTKLVVFIPSSSGKAESSLFGLLVRRKVKNTRLGGYWLCVVLYSVDSNYSYHTEGVES